MSVNIFSVTAQTTKQIVKQQQQEIDSLKAILLQMSTDTDGDGVYDFYDRCEETPIGARVDGVGCALDTDMDGIFDLYDDCVTVQGVPMLKGCPEPDFEIIDCTKDETQPIEFDYQKAELKEYMKPIIKNACNIIQNQGKGMRFSITGYSFDYNSTKKNMKLGLKRAQAVYDYMVELEPCIAHQLEINSEGDTDLLYPECEDPEHCKEKGDEWKNRANNRVIFQRIEDNTTY